MDRSSPSYPLQVRAAFFRDHARQLEGRDVAVVTAFSGIGNESAGRLVGAYEDGLVLQGRFGKQTLAGRVYVVYIDIVMIVEISPVAVATSSS
jgi:hypothetical protein